MRIKFLLYYLLQVVKAGHQWQNIDVNGLEHKNRFYFSLLQWIAVIYAIAFTLINSTGFSHDTIDYCLSALAVMSGLFLGLVVMVLDKSDRTDYNANTDNLKAKKKKLWNFYYQFVALTSYAILIALLEIGMLLGTLLYGEGTDLDYYSWTFNDISINSVFVFTKCLLVVIVRICSVYFLIDFFLLSIYAVSSIFQVVKINMEENKPEYEVRQREDMNQAIQNEHLPYKKSLVIFWIIIFLTVVFLVLK